MTEPAALCATFIACLREFQTLTAGGLAVVAAAFTGYVVWRSANVPVTAQRRREEAMAVRKQSHECLVLSSQLQILQRRASQAAGTIRAVAGAGGRVNDETKDKIYLTTPRVIADWEVMSILPSDVVDRCLELMQHIDDHNYDISRVGGPFGADDFRASLLRRLDAIIVASLELAKDIKGQRRV